MSSVSRNIGKAFFEKIYEIFSERISELGLEKYEISSGNKI